MARNHLLSLSFSVDIYAKSLGERTSGGAFVIISRALQLPLNLRKFLQFSYTISLIVNGLIQIIVTFSEAVIREAFQPFSTVYHGHKWPHKRAHKMKQVIF